jgi:tetratricopeptide (TPR) repeat protein
MSSPNAQLGFFNLRRRAAKVGVILALLAVMIFGWYAVTRQLGNMLAGNAQMSDPNFKAVVEAAGWLAPSDPLTNWKAASLAQDVLSDEKMSAATEGFERTVRLAPYDYRLWVELGKAREQSGDEAGAEKALLRAVELAPTYAHSRWQLGNFYLRQNREQEAFSELKKAGENNHTYREQVFYTVWEFYGRDPKKLEEIVGSSPQVTANLAKFYAAKDEAENCVRTWNTLSPEQKADNQGIADLIMQSLFERKHFRAAAAFAAQLGKEPEAAPEKIYNAGFEGSIEQAPLQYFNWRSLNVDKVEIRLDGNQKREGKRSIRLNFNGYKNPLFTDLAQFVAVEPGARYRLTFWLRTENLKSAGPPTLEVAEVNTGKVLEFSSPFPTGTNEWQQMSVNFTAPTAMDGVMIRTGRSYCGDNCPIVGMAWYDDFKLERVSGGK